MEELFSNKIWTQIGSLTHPEEDNALRASLTPSQLLDLLAWLDLFGPNGSILHHYPYLWKSCIQTYFQHYRADITTDIKPHPPNFDSYEGIQWAQDQLLHFSTLCRNEFLSRIHTQSDLLLENIYTATHSQYTSSLTTQNAKMESTLCTDIYTYLSLQLHTLITHTHIHHQDQNLISESMSIFMNQLRSKQTQYRYLFLDQSLEWTMAAANDFLGLSDQCEERIHRLQQELYQKRSNPFRNLSNSTPRPTLEKEREEDDEEDQNDTRTEHCKKNEEYHQDDFLEELLENSIQELLILYSKDAVYAAQSIHMYVLEPIQTQIGPKLFTREWEELSTHNQEILSLLQTVEDFWVDIVDCLDTLLLPKALEAIMNAIISFYIQTLLERSNHHSSITQPYWANETRVLDRIEQDLILLKDFFQTKYNHLFPLQTNESSSSSSNSKDAPKRMPTQTVEHEFKVLYIILELVGVAFGTARPKHTRIFRPKRPIFKNTNLEKRSWIDEASSLVLFLHQHIRDEEITQRIAGDIWHLAAPQKEYKIWQYLRNDRKWRNLQPIRSNDNKHPFWKLFQKKKPKFQQTSCPQAPPFDTQQHNTKKEIPSENFMTLSKSSQTPGVLLDLTSLLQTFYKDPQNKRKIPKKDNAVKKVRRKLTPVPKPAAIPLELKGTTTS